MQAKDALQALVDDSLLRVEKIGSGNWYWAFVGDERKRLVGMMKSLGDEREGLKRIVEGLKEVVLWEGERVRSEAGGEDVGGLVAEMGRLRKEKEMLEGELEGYREGDPGEVERRRALVGKAKAAVNQVTGEGLTLGLMRRWDLSREIGEEKKMIALALVADESFSR